MKESQIIDFISKLKCSDFKKSDNYGIGDDTAIIKINNQNSYLISTDSLTEGIHFDFDLTTPYQLGKKSVYTNVSDILSSGGIPECFFLNLVIPEKINFSVKQFLKGLNKAALEFNMILLGGDTITSKNDFTISITIIGKAKNKNIVYRDKNKPGDLVYVLDYPGLASVGYNVLKTNNKDEIKKYKKSVNRYLQPKPNILITEISNLFTSATDISDGLLTSAYQLIEKNNNGIFLDLKKDFLHSEIKRYIKKYNKNYFDLINWGDDYILLFTIDKKNKNKLENICKKNKIILNLIGEIQKNNIKKYIFNNKTYNLNKNKLGYQHSFMI